MSESCVIEVYENEAFDRVKGGWILHKEFPYVMKATLQPCKPLDEITLPDAEGDDGWQWATNWKISKMPGVTDSEGWEYASRFNRFKDKNRAPKAEAAWSRARRRLWTRIMRRETTVKASEISKVLPKIQLGLSSVHSARMKIEEIMKHAPEAANSDQMLSLVTSVNRNISDILAVLDQAEKNFAQEEQQAITNANSKGGGTKSGGNPNASNSPAVLKKLRNDVLKEQAAIERALERRGQETAASSSSERKNSNPPSNNTSSRVPSSKNNGVATSSSGKGMGDNSNNSNNNGFNNGGHRTNSVELRQDLNGINQVISKQKGAVKSGSAGAFNPSMFAQHTPNPNVDGPEDGVFVDRNTHDLLIEQKLIPIDESVVMQEIIDDRHNEILKINKGIIEINEMFDDLSKLVKEQEVEVRHIYDNIDESHIKTKEAFAHIVEASRLQREGQCSVS